MLAVTSGTAALHLALLALGVGPGDEVITSPITWPATANVIEHCGATPVFCDVREGDLNIDAALIPALVTERTKAIMPVHLAGQPADLDPILALGLPVVEDAAHAAESRYRGRKVGGISTRRASRSTRRRTSPPARAGSWRRIERRRSPTRSGTCASRGVATGRSTTRSPPGSRRTSRTCSRRSRSSSSTASTRTRRSGSASSRSTTRGSRGWTASRRSSATPGTRTPSTSTRSGSTPRQAPARRATRTSTRSPTS